MIRLRYAAGQQPAYMTEHSAGADLCSRVSLSILPGKAAAVPTGVWIDEVAWNLVPENTIPELQIRARSGLALKKRITLANGVGTIDADYPDEIAVLLINLGEEAFQIKPGDRIAQIVLNLVHRISGLPVGAMRSGGMGSTGIAIESPIGSL